ncbi:MAG: lipocalin family protein [Bacteroidales bacterium]|nr:lipocalin family protein [Bacteroidales bacterium]
MKKAMKIMAMVLFAIGMTALTSCSKDKDKLIIGKWEISSISISGGSYNMDLTMEEFYELLGADAEDAEPIVLEFRNDGKVYMVDMDDDVEEGLPYSIDGDKLTVQVTDEEGNEEYETMIIKELTEKAMTLERTGMVEELDDDMTVALHFKKVK